MLFTHQPTADNQQLADKWSRTVAAFARTGDPNGHGLPDWPQYRSNSHQCLWISQASDIVANPDADMLEIYRVA